MAAKAASALEDLNATALSAILSFLPARDLARLRLASKKARYSVDDFASIELRRKTRAAAEEASRGFPLLPEERDVLVPPNKVLLPEATLRSLKVLREALSCQRHRFLDFESLRSLHRPLVAAIDDSQVGRKVLAVRGGSSSSNRPVRFRRRFEDLQTGVQ